VWWPLIFRFALNEFVNQLHLSEHGRAFIIEADGS
jgi:hypothetical protein